MTKEWIALGAVVAVVIIVIAWVLVKLEKIADHNTWEGEDE